MFLILQINQRFPSRNEKQKPNEEKNGTNRQTANSLTFPP